MAISRGLGLIFALLLTSGVLFAHTGPFGPAGQDDISEQSFIRQAITGINAYQLELKQKMTALVKDLKDHKTPGTLMLLLFISFIYGVVHSIGPGHGKGIILSYLIAFKGSLKKGIAIGALAAFFHGLSAIILVLAIYYLSLGRVVGTFDLVSSRLMILSSVGIIIIGGLIFTRGIYGIYLDMRSAEPDQGLCSRGSVLAMILCLGIVPCPGAMIILLFFLAMGLLNIGIWMALCMSAGMALSVSMIGLAGLVFKNSLVRLSKRFSSRFLIVQRSLEITGAMLIVIIGSVLLHAYLH